MSDLPDGALLDLQREYLSELPAQLAKIRTEIGAFREGREGAGNSLRARFHQLAGSGGSYGFPEISSVAREMEHWVATEPPATEAARLEAAVDRLAAIVHRAATPSPALELRRPTELRVRLVLPPSPERDQLTRDLQQAGYQVQYGSRTDDPAALPAAYRPDLLVIGLGPGEGDPSAVASNWTSRWGRRPRAVVLIETLRAIDRLRAGAAGVDAVLPVERMLEELPRYARVLATSGAPPSTVLLVEADAEQSAAISERLGTANVRVVRTPLAAAVQQLLDREVPDLLLLSTRLSDGDGFALARSVRQDPRFGLLPIVLLGTDDVSERIEAIRAGADDFLVHPIHRELLLQTVISRAERARRLRELLHRDELTGLLNHTTLMAELEYAVDYGRRHGGPLAFVVFDLDRFSEINERFGQTVGDQVLLHVANVFRSNVRASDVIGRFGGEEFGMILRGGSPEGAAVLATKIRRVLGEQAATTAEGIIIPLNVSIGWASYPADGSTAGELAHSAVRAMRKEKAEKA
ncbi:MAG: diguanylate cyclase [Gemmatimonadales bacterium]